MMPAQAFSSFENLSGCPVCGATGYKRLYGKSVCQCRECDVIFRSPRPTQEDIKESYDQGKQYAAWATNSEKLKLLWKQRLALVQKYASGGRMLDVGVGDGRFLTLAREAGFQVEGTEISDTGGKIAESMAFKIHYGQLTDIEFNEARFKVITIWHVLEHVPNPGEVISKLFNLLEPGGVLVVAVPNEENTLFRYRLKGGPSNPLGELCWGTEIHLTHFQPETFKTALRRSGLRVMEFGVDDIYYARTVRNRFVLWVQKWLNQIFGWHFSMAMYAICEKAAK